MVLQLEVTLMWLMDECFVTSVTAPYFKGVDYLITGAKPSGD